MKINRTIKFTPVNLSPCVPTITIGGIPEDDPVA